MGTTVDCKTDVKINKCKDCKDDICDSCWQIWKKDAAKWDDSYSHQQTTITQGICRNCGQWACRCQ